MNTHRYSSLLLLCLVFMSLLGCDGLPGRPSKAQAILKVSRAAVNGNASDFMIYKETQASLLRSNFVVTNALNNQEIASIQGVSVTAVQQAIEIQVDETELMFVTLDQGGWPRLQTKRILDEVIKSYQSEIVNKERVEKVDQLAHLRRRYTTAYQMVMKKSDEVTAQAQQTGEVDQKDVAIRIEIMKSKMQHLDSTLIQLELAKIDIDEDDAAAKAIAQKKIDFVKGESESLIAEIVKFKEASGELVARREDLAALQKDMRDVRSKLRLLESEIDGPRAVSVLQAAAVLE